ncbi:TATA-box-binding protein [Halarchaeum acidiphilum]|uniref:TATA-box-binding protein C n=1 Tax=Halarchaeum acidiphilum TaxID=489138 RepID=UPI00131F4449|nr:TATA-box-binding protein C [Halarchaeum acidiphilum]
MVNVVGSGDINCELDLDLILPAIKEETTISVSRTNQGLKIEFSGRTGTVSLYRSGKYTIMGSASEEELYRTNDCFLELCIELGIITDADNTSLHVSNYVYAVELDENVNLNHLDILLGEEAEYEPEQFSYVVYRPSDIDCTMTISTSGKCVINTPVGDEEVENAIKTVISIIDSSPAG